MEEENQQGPADISQEYPKITGEFEQFRPVDNSPQEKLDFIKGKRYRRVTRAAIKHLVDLDGEKRLISLMKEMEREISRMELSESSPYEIRRERNQSEVAREIKSLLLKFGIARLLKQGDWIINRKAEIPLSMGVIDFTEILQYISEFHDSHSTDNFDANDNYKLVAVDLGCGNGEFCEILRTEVENEPGRKWEVLGYADCIYFTLNDLLKNLLKDEYADDIFLQEFIDVVATLLIRELYKRENSDDERKPVDILSALPSNLDSLRNILPELVKYIDLEGREKINVDLEFLSDSERKLSQGCKEMIEEYFKSPEEFIGKYFISQTQDLTDEEKQKLADIERSTRALSETDRRNTAKITLKIRRIGDDTRRTSSESGSGIKRKPGRNTLNRLDQLKSLEIQKNLLKKKIPKLSGYSSLYPFNVIPGKFEEFKEIFPKSSIHYAYSFRSTSHADNESYINFYQDVARSIAPGGVYLDDGKKESWTRFERIALLRDLQHDLGDEFRIRIVCDEENAKSVLLERGFKLDDGSIEFFTDKFGEKILMPGNEFIEIDQWETRLPQIMIRNRVIEVLKKLFSDKEKWPSGNMHFKDVHATVDDAVRNEVNISMWEYLVEYDGGVSAEIKKTVDSISDKIVKVVMQELRERKLGNNEVVPLYEKSVVQTFPRLSAVEDSHGVNNERVFPVERMPRNKDIPTLEHMKRKSIELIKGLEKLKDEFKKQPLHVFEFDDCFTNGLMMDLLNRILSDACFIFNCNVEDFVKVSNVRLKNGEYPNMDESGLIYILGGSVNSAADKYGRKFTEEFCKPLLEYIKMGGFARALGVCFGSQTLMQAFGQLEDRKIKTISGALQYGAFPVALSKDKSGILDDMRGSKCAVGMTREDYTCFDDGNVFSGNNIEPLAHELRHENGNIFEDNDIAPAAFSLYSGRVVTTQFHPEISLTDPETENRINDWFSKNRYHVYSTFVLSDKMPSLQFDLKGRNMDGEEPWVERDAGPAFMLNTLLYQVNSLIEQLKQYR